MPSITVLPDELKNKIAAGEVVERPASVVKELVENSIDAGSTAIELEVLYGGRRLIRVSDNGVGMDKDDAFLCLQRHATSKLHTEDDLFNIRTMGFRGEALPSIASVSKLTLITAPKGSSSGVSVEVIGGEIKEIKDAPSNGTSVEVRDLFFNTPARKKFLKKDSTELMHIIDTVTRLSLSHPEIRFNLKAEGQETIALPRASSLRERLMQVYGSEFLEGLVEFENETSGLKINAFVSKTDNLRSTRAHQFVFVNKRPVKDSSVSHAVYSALEGVIPQGRHPIYFIFLEVDPRKVDFNVHPTKREIRFEDKEVVYRFIKRSVMDAVRAGFRPSDVKVSVNVPESTEDAVYAPTPEKVFPVKEPQAELTTIPLAYKTELPFIYLGDTFIAFSEGEGLTLIDHHAAHERILYEKFLKGIDLESHQLLFPRQVRLSPKEYMVILENRDILASFGIELDDFGHDTVVVRSLPDVMNEADLRGILSDVAQEILDGIKPGQSLKEALAARIACHRSIRGRKILSSEGLDALLRDLSNADDPEHCPHGRPTKIFLSLDELKKMFGRK
jgi:DNA mismatch repair protein MutL